MDEDPAAQADRLTKQLARTRHALDQARKNMALSKLRIDQQQQRIHTLEASIAPLHDEIRRAKEEPKRIERVMTEKMSVLREEQDRARKEFAQERRLWLEQRDEKDREIGLLRSQTTRLRSYVSTPGQASEENPELVTAQRELNTLKIQLRRLRQQKENQESELRARIRDLEGKMARRMRGGRTEDLDDMADTMQDLEEDLRREEHANLDLSEKLERSETKRRSLEKKLKEAQAVAKQTAPGASGKSSESDPELQAQLKAMSAAKLKALLKLAGLKQGGNKGTLIGRIMENRDAVELGGAQPAGGDEAELLRLTKAELQQIAQEKGLAGTGTKADIVARIAAGQ